MANFSKEEANKYAIQQNSEGDCWQAALAMAINLKKKNANFVNLSYMRQATSSFTKSSNNWASAQTWHTVGRQTTFRCSLNLGNKTLTEFATDSWDLATKMINALRSCSVLILSVHNNSGGYHDVVVAGYQGMANGLWTDFVVIDPATGAAAVVPLGTLWEQGIMWIAGVDSGGG